MATAEYPAELKYHKEHDWVRVDGDVAEFGVTWHAQDALGDIVFFQPPAVGDPVNADSSYGELESVKAVSDVIAPVDGEVVAINEEVVEKPELVNETPYGAWLIRVKLKSPAQLDELLDADEYQGLL